jgi:hypothetical protein
MKIYCIQGGNIGDNNTAKTISEKISKERGAEIVYIDANNTTLLNDIKNKDTVIFAGADNKIKINDVEKPIHEFLNEKVSTEKGKKLNVMFTTHENYNDTKIQNILKNSCITRLVGLKAFDTKAKISNVHLISVDTLPTFKSGIELSNYEQALEKKDNIPSAEKKQMISILKDFNNYAVFITPGDIDNKNFMLNKGNFNDFIEINAQKLLKEIRSDKKCLIVDGGPRTGKYKTDGTEDTEAHNFQNSLFKPSDAVNKALYAKLQELTSEEEKKNIIFSGFYKGIPSPLKAIYEVASQNSENNKFYVNDESVSNISDAINYGLNYEMVDVPTKVPDHVTFADYIKNTKLQSGYSSVDEIYKANETTTTNAIVRALNTNYHFSENKQIVVRTSGTEKVSISDVNTEGAEELKKSILNSIEYVDGTLKRRSRVRFDSLGETDKQEITEIVQSVTLNVSENKLEPQEDCNPVIKTKVEELCQKLNSQRGR